MEKTPEAPKELWITYSQERLDNEDCLEAFKTEAEAKEWKHVGPSIKYVRATELEAMRIERDRYHDMLLKKFKIAMCANMDCTLCEERDKLSRKPVQE